MSNCNRCEARLGRDAAFCSACGAPTEAALLDIITEVDLDDGSYRGDVVVGRSRSRRPRNIGLLVAAAFVAVVAAGVVGSRRGEKAIPPGTTRSTTPISAFTPTTDVVSELPTTTPQTAAPPTTTTTAPGPISIGTAPLLGEPTGLAALVVVAAGHVLRIDFDTATATPTPVELNGDGAYLARTSLGMLVATFQRRGEVRLYRYDGSEPSTIDVPGTFIGEGPPGRLWFSDYENAVFGVPRLHYIEPASGDGVVNVGLDTPTSNMLVDGSGLLTVAPGGTYRVQPPAPPTRISTGTAIGAGDHFVVERSCDRQLRCDVAVLDTSTGRRRPVSVVGLASLETGLGGALVSPDGKWVASMQLVVENNIGHGRLTVAGVDGSVVDLGGFENPCISPQCPTSPSWSADGSWLIGVRDHETIWAWRPGLSAPLEVPTAVPSNGSGRLGFGAIVPIPQSAQFGSPPTTTA